MGNVTGKKKLRFKGPTMETLPFEMVEKISQYLTPQDLARCCAVSPGWRQIFNEDSLWRPLCDPELEEPLRITPCVIKPGFVSPEVEESTLAPICCWRLAFMREHHLWKNWKLNKRQIQNLPDSEYNDYNEEHYFIADNVVVRWSSYEVEVWDLNAIPATCVGKTDPIDSEIVVSTAIGINKLLVMTMETAMVFHVDLINKCIKLKHDILLNYSYPCMPCYNTKRLNTVKGNILMHVNRDGLNFEIFDLELGISVKQEPCPVVGNGNEKAIYEIASYPSSDYVLVIVDVSWSPDGQRYHYYIYNLKQQLFLSGPITKTSIQQRYRTSELHNHYFAISELDSLTIFDCQTSEVVYKNQGQPKIVSSPQGYNGNFVFVDFADGKYGLKMYSLTNKTVTTIFEHVPDIQVGGMGVNVVNNRFVIFLELIRDPESVVVFESSGQTLKRVDIIIKRLSDYINRTFTRGWCWDEIQEISQICYYW